MPTEPIVAETDAAPAEHNPETAALDAFNEAMKNVPEEGTPDAAPKESLKPPKAEAKTDAQPSDKPAADSKSAIPEEFLTGKKEGKEQSLELSDSDVEEALKTEVPQNLPKGSRENIRKLHDTLQYVESKRVALLKKLEAAQANEDTSSKELKALREALAEREQLLERVAFEHSAGFQKFAVQEKRHLDQAKAFLEGTDINPNVIELAARSTPANRLKILREAGADAETIAAVSPYLAGIDAINADRAAALENHKATSAQREAQERQYAEQQEAARKSQEETVFKRVGEEVAKRFEPFQKVEGHDKWNAQVEQLNSEAREFYSGNLPLERVAEIAYYGVGARVIHEMNGTLQSRLKEALAENAKLKAAQPSEGNTNGTPAGEDKDLSPEESAKRTFEKLMRG